MRVIVVSNSHIDPVWLWDKYEGIDEVVNTFKSACDRLDENPMLTFAASSTCFYQWVEELAPELFNRIKQHVASGRWEVAGAWWVEGDTNLPLKESFIESARISRAYLKARLGTNPVVAFSPDTFGHPADLPSVLAETGFKYYGFSRPNIREKSDLPNDLFWWRHGRNRVLCYRFPYHYSGGVNDLKDSVTNERFSCNGLGCFLFGVGDHGGGPTKDQVERVNAIIAEAPEIFRYGTLLEFFENAQKLDNIPEYEGDLHYHAVGCYSVNRNLKEGVRKSEHALSYAKRVGCSDLDAPWKTTLFNEFHDILPGSCAPNAANQALNELGGAICIAEDKAYRAVKNLSAKIPVDCPQGEFRVYNSLPFDVKNPIELESFMYFRPGAQLLDETGKVIPYQQIPPSVRCVNRRWLLIDKIPSRSFRRYHFDDSSSEEPMPTYASGQAIQSTIYRIEKPGQVFKGNSPVFAHTPMLWVVDDSSDTWSHGIEGFGDGCAHFRVISHAILEGPLVSHFTQELAFEKSTATMTYKLYAGLPFFDLDILVRWEEIQRVLKLELTLIRPFEHWTVQGACGSIVKHTHRREEPLHGWLEAGDLRFVQDGAYAVDHMDDRIRITLVRSNWYGFHDPYNLDPLAPMEPTDVGKHRFRFRFYTEATNLDHAHAAFIEPFKVIRENR
jgi:alpha-mannosidase